MCTHNYRESWHLNPFFDEIIMMVKEYSIYLLVFKNKIYFDKTTAIYGEFDISRKRSGFYLDRAVFVRFVLHIT